MAGTATVNISARLTGLGESSFNLSDSFTDATPTKVVQQYRVLASADSDEALDLGDISTVEGIMIRAVDLDLDVDCDYVDSFNADLDIAAGECAYFKPEGTVKVKNGTASETPAYEYIAWGT